MATHSTVRYTKGPERKVGKVFTRLILTNTDDRALVSRGFLDPDDVRSLVVEDVLVDTGATTLCLPSDLIDQLGLDLVREVDILTAAGPSTSRVFTGVRLEVQGRSASFDCLELAAGSPPLVGLIPLEALGLEPDLQNQRLRLLPESGPQNYLTVL